jgi:glycosyltransferase involved in cell wall biosynthesis
MNKSLSIVIPTFRRKESLQRLLQRLLAQRNVRAEIIVVDQNPEGYLDRSLPEDGSIRRLRLAEANASTARNEGFLTSTGDIILFIDDDLIPEDDFAQMRCKYSKNTPVSTASHHSFTTQKAKNSH